MDLPNLKAERLYQKISTLLIGLIKDGTLTGPGKAWLQSMPILNLAESIAHYLPRGESSVTDTSAAGVVGGIVGSVIRSMVRRRGSQSPA